MKNLLLAGLVLNALCNTANAALATGEPKEAADILGRNGGLFNPLGHIGLWTGSNVMEVMPKEKASPTVIRATGLSSFKSAGYMGQGYWGASYTANLLRSQKTNIINQGWNQRLYNPQYTIVPTYTEGYSKNVCVRHNGVFCVEYRIQNKDAVFRCDTFAYFSYLKGASRTLISGGATTSTPKRIFSSLPSKR